MSSHALALHNLHLAVHDELGPVGFHFLVQLAGELRAGVPSSWE